jgi:hypothetical protein
MLLCQHHYRHGLCAETLSQTDHPLLEDKGKRRAPYCSFFFRTCHQVRQGHRIEGGPDLACPHHCMTQAK